MRNTIFTIFFFGVIIFSWVLYSTRAPFGFVEKVATPQFSLEGFLDCNYQKTAEKYLARKIPSLKYLLYLKNDIYDLLNFGFFHAGYDRTIIQGKDGILFEYGNLSVTYGNTPPEVIRELSQKSALELKRLNSFLAERGIPLIVVLAPCKVDFFDFATPWRFKVLNPELKIGSANVGPIYEELLARDGIHFVNCFPILDKPGLREISFPDRGTHWTLHSSALCLEKIASELHHINPDKFPLIDITGTKKIREFTNAESDLADLLNIWPKYSRGKPYAYMADFAPLNKPYPLLLHGDSFSHQIHSNMILSGYSTWEMIKYFENRSIPREEFLSLLKEVKAVILVGNVLKFILPQWWLDLAAPLNKYLEEDNSARAAGDQNPAPD